MHNLEKIKIQIHWIMDFFCLRKREREREESKIKIVLKCKKNEHRT